MKKKLLIVSTDTIHVYNYLRLIEGYFDEVLLLTNHRNEKENFKTEVVDFSLRNPLKYPAIRKRIRSIVDEFKPSVIHIHQANSVALHTLKACRKIDIPKILTAWGSDILLLPKKGGMMKRMVQYNLEHADVFTSDSRFMAEEMRRLGAGKKEILIANFGINVEKVDLPKENIIYSNRLHKPLYRVDKIVRAFAQFSKKNQDWKLVVAATGDETEMLKKLSVDLGLNGKVEFAGWVDKQKNSEYYSKAKIWVSIPESDATSISLLEAMAFGCLPVVSDLPANREWIENGKNGVVVRDLDGDFISAALNLDMQKVAEQNAQIIAEHGTKEANRRKFVELYDSLL